MQTIPIDTAYRKSAHEGRVARLRAAATGSALVRDIGLFALILLLAFLTLYPLAMLFYGSLSSTPPGMEGVLNLDGYAKVMSPRNAAILFDTVVLSLVKTVISLAGAVLLAWIIARTDTPMRGPLEVLITLPFFIPPILTAMAWGMLGNPQLGVINLAWTWLTGFQGPLINVYSWGGVVWHMCQYSIPFLFLFLVDAFRAMDPSLEDCSRMCGASRWMTFRRITILLIYPVLTSSFILSFIKGIEAFESPLFFGTAAGVNVITTEIYSAINHSARADYQYATALSFVVLGLMLLLVLWQWWVLRGRSFQTVTGKGFRPAVVELGPWRWVTFGICVLFFVLTVAFPIGQILVGSLFKFFGFYSWDMLTFEHYRNVWRNQEFWRALRNTATLGLVGATATMLLGALVAYVSVRTEYRGRRLIDLMAWLPWMMPGMILGVGFLWAFAVLPGPLQIYGTIWALLIAYMALGTPVATRVMSGAYHQLSYDLEECSRVHGASWLQTMRYILIALAWPAFAVGWVLTFFSIMRELSASILLYSVGSEVLSVTLLKMWSNGRMEQVSVIGLMMILLVILLRWLQLRVIRSRVSKL